MDKEYQESNQPSREIIEIVVNAIKERFADRPDILNNLNNIISYFQTKRPSVTKPIRDQALALIAIAERDRKDCKLLYCKKSYANAVLHLQQSVEKATKAYLLGNGLLNETEVFGHTTPALVFRALFDKTGLRQLAPQLPDSSTNGYIRDAYSILKNKDKRIELARIPFVNIKKTLAFMEDTRKKNEGMLIELEQQLLPLLGYQPSSVSPMVSTKSISILTTLYMLAVYTFPHATFSRYADGPLKSSDYTKSMGIVRAIPALTKYLKRAIKELKSTLV